MKGHPLIPVALCLILGIILGRWSGVGAVKCWLIAATILLSITLCLFRLRLLEGAQSVLILIAIVAVGGARESISLQRYSTPQSYWQRAQTVALEFRENLVDIYIEAGLEKRELATTLAMTLGDKRALTTEQRQEYAVAGVAHALALSGLHLSIICSILTLGKKRHSIFHDATIIIIIWAFITIVGLPPSAVRAGLMLTIVTISKIAGRQGLSMGNLAIAAIIMLLSNPDALYDIGWQLSFVAVLSIIILHSAPVPMLKAIVVKSEIASIILTTIAATIGTAPIIAYHFHILPLLSPITNIIVEPCLMVIMFLSPLVLLATPSPALQVFLCKILDIIATMMNDAIESIASLPFAAISI